MPQIPPITLTNQQTDGLTENVLVCPKPCSCQILSMGTFYKGLCRLYNLYQKQFKDFENMFVHHCYYGNHHHDRHHLKSWPWKRRRMRWRAINFTELDPLLLLWLPSPIYVVLMVTTMLVGVRHIFLATLLFGAGVCKWNSINMNRHTISTIKIIRSFLRDSI